MQTVKVNKNEAESIKNSTVLTAFFLAPKTIIPKKIRHK